MRSCRGRHSTNLHVVSFSRLLPSISRGVSGNGHCAALTPISPSEHRQVLCITRPARLLQWAAHGIGEIPNHISKPGSANKIPELKPRVPTRQEVEGRSQYGHSQPSICFGRVDPESVDASTVRVSSSLLTPLLPLVSILAGTGSSPCCR